MIHPTDKDIGRGVIYCGHGGERERGTITSIRHADKTFVNYGRGSTSALTKNEQLEWEHPTMLDEIVGKRNPETGRFEVTHWPKPRMSNPNFLTDLLKDSQKGRQS
jgi:hypothetical protein